MKLLWKILLPVTVLIAILVGVSGYIAYKQSAESLEKAVIDNMQDEAYSLKRMTASVLDNSRQSVVRASSNIAILNLFQEDPADKDKQLELAKALETLIKGYHDIDRFNVFNLEGDIISSSNPAVIGQNFKTREYFTAAASGKTFISAPFKSNITKQGVIIISTPIQLSGRTVGVLNATVPLPTYFRDVFEPVQIGNLGYAYAMNSDGQIVMHKDAKWLFRTDLPGMELYKKMASSPDGSLSFINAAGLDSFAYFVKEPLSGMTLVVQAEKDDVFSGLSALSRTSMVIVIVSILIGVALLVIIVRPIVNAINRSASFAVDVANGKLGGSLEMRRKDEIGILADALRSIPDSLKSIVAEYKSIEDKLEYGEIQVQGNTGSIPGEFADLVEGTNRTLARYQQIINALTSPVAVLNNKMQVVYLNDAARKLAGDDYHGKSAGDVLAADDYSKHDCALKQAASSLKPVMAETVMRPRGTAMDIEYTAIPFTDANGKLSMILQLITDLTQIKSTQRVIMDVAAQAGDISNRVAAASQQLSAQVAQVSNGTAIQRDRANSTATAMEEMNSTVLEVARNAASASEQADATSRKATEGSSLVNQVVSAINDVHTSAEELDKSMKDLGVQTDAIGNVLNVISDIADQTNLLALNAAIEAARAGEAGRGFAVVADEVRKLAEKTMTATTEVESNIKNIQKATSDNILRMREAGEGTVRATEIAAVSGKALEEILHLAQTNTALISSIATAAEEQSATSEEISSAVEAISQIAGETATGMSDSTEAVEELARMAQELQALLERLRQ
ncbi:methyl-accepting chemotaxis protein [Desulfovibrio sp. OttesenSCG-928-C06]|nr:methyl-accepting chemotaxis protein [Desulfovibrio sp. OttesenSCG-928-C06]